MIVAGEYLPILVLDVVSYTAWAASEPDAVRMMDDHGGEYLFVRGYPFIIRKQRG